MKLLHLFVWATVLWLTGCATTQTDTHNSDAAAGLAGTSHSASSGDGLSLPPLQPITPAQARSSGVASLTPPSDLWERIRRGFAMPNLQDDLVDDRVQWYSTRPDYILRMTQRSSKYLFHIVEELERRGMPTELALLPYIESAFNP